MVCFGATRIQINALSGSGSGSRKKNEVDTDPDLDPLRFLFPDQDPLKKALIWIRVEPNPKLCRVKSKTKCFCYLRMPFLNFGGNKNKYCNLSDMDPNPLFPNVDPKIRIHYLGKVYPKIQSTIPKCGAQDPDPDARQNEMDPKRWNLIFCLFTMSLLIRVRRARRV